jgi:hypothetical protein
MGDPISALAAAGAVANIVQITEFSGKVLYYATVLLKSGNALNENVEIERLVAHHNEITQHAPVCDASQQNLPPLALALQRRAEEINHDAGDLLALLEDLKVTETKNKAKRAYQSARQATRALAYRSKIEKKQRNLHELTNQLAVVMLQDLSQTQVEIHADLKECIKDTMTKVIESASSSSAKDTQPMPDDDLRLQLPINESLRFPDIDSREDAIFRSYDQTSEWIFDDKTANFSSWLSAGSGIFWLCGTPGSGKSTLMKFIAGHARTLALLETWASEQGRCVITSFYFWYLGTSMQRSIKGLLQTIVHSIFQQCPGLARTVCPTRWELVQSGCPQPAWTEQELFQVVRSIAQHDHDNNEANLPQDKGSQKRFTFFIDGLDELSGDHSALVTALQDLARGGRMKLCVSCRPWNVFLNAIGHCKHVIHLQNLITKDIELYVRGSLTEAEERQRKRSLSSAPFKRREPQAERLISAVVEKANGVFLWVYLAVRSLLSGFEEGDSIAIMQRRIDELPGDLIPYFKLMLSRMDQVYRQITSSALLLAAIPTRFAGQGLVYVSFLDLWPMLESPDYFEDVDFAFKDTYTFCSSEDLQAMKLETAQQIRASCRDLLHIPWSRKALNHDGTDLAFLRHSKVEYLHRTVHDFLLLDEVRQELFENSPRHLQDPGIAVRVALARAKIAPISHPGEVCLNLDELGSAICEHSSDSRVLSQLDELEEYYVTKYCPDACPIHVRPPSSRTMERHRCLLDHRLYRAICSTYAKRLACSRTRLGERHGADEVQMLRISLGTVSTLALGSKRDALSIHHVRIELIVHLLEAGAKADELLSAFEPSPAIPVRNLIPLDIFLRHWALADTTHEENERLWEVVKLLVREGARVPRTCKIPDANGRKSMASDVTDYTVDAGLWDFAAETICTFDALEMLVPRDKRKEVARMKAEVCARMEI